MKMKIVWNNTVIAESEDFRIVERRFYFPPSSVQKQYLKKNGKNYFSRWKGTADCYDLIVDGKKNEDAALSYEKPLEGLEKIKGYFSFSDEVQLIKGIVQK